MVSPFSSNLPSSGGGGRPPGDDDDDDKIDAAEGGPLQEGSISDVTGKQDTLFEKIASAVKSFFSQSTSWLRRGSVGSYDVEQAMKKQAMTPEDVSPIIHHKVEVGTPDLNKRADVKPLGKKAEEDSPEGIVSSLTSSWEEMKDRAPVAFAVMGLNIIAKGLSANRKVLGEKVLRVDINEASLKHGRSLIVQMGDSIMATGNPFDFGIMIDLALQGPFLLQTSSSGREATGKLEAFLQQMIDDHPNSDIRQILVEIQSSLPSIMDEHGFTGLYSLLHHTIAVGQELHHEIFQQLVLGQEHQVNFKAADLEGQVSLLRLNALNRKDPESWKNMISSLTGLTSKGLAGYIARKRGQSKL